MLAASQNGDPVRSMTFNFSSDTQFHLLFFGPQFHAKGLLIVSEDETASHEEIQVTMFAHGMNESDQPFVQTCPLSNDVDDDAVLENVLVSHTTLLYFAVMLIGIPVCCPKYQLSHYCLV